MNPCLTDSDNNRSKMSAIYLFIFTYSFILRAQPILSEMFGRIKFPEFYPEVVKMVRKFPEFSRFSLIFFQEVLFSRFSLSCTSPDQPLSDFQLTLKFSI